MAQQSKSNFVVIGLVAAGAVILFLALNQPKPVEQKGIVINDLMKNEPHDPVPSPAIVTDTDFGKQTGFAVQVYSFQDKARAERALQNLKQASYDAYLIISDLGEKGTWYRIRIGGLLDEKSAQQTLEAIRKNYNSGFIIKPLTK